MTKHHELMIRAAELYYQRHYLQSAIARELGVSTAMVSRLLKYARDQGYVQVEISALPEKRLGEELKRHFSQFGIREVLVSPPGLPALAQRTARYFEAYVRAGDTIILDGGKSTHLTIESMTHHSATDLLIGPIVADYSSFENSAYEAMRMLADRNPIRVRLLRLPHVDTPALKEDRSRIVGEAQHANWVLLGVGPADPSYTALKLFRYMGKHPEDVLKAYPMLAAISGYVPLDKQSELVKDLTKESYFPLRALNFSDLVQRCTAETARVLLIAASEEKASAVEVVLRARMVNTLAVDESLARRLIGTHLHEGRHDPVLRKRPQRKRKPSK